MDMKNEKVVSRIISALLIISPLVIISPAVLSIDFFKSMTITILAIVAGLVIVYSLWSEHKIEISRHPLFITSSVVALVYVISALFSGAIGVSFFGQGVEVDTASFFLSLWLILMLVSMLTKSVSKTFSVYTAIIVPFIILAIFHILRIVGGANFLTLGVLNGLTASFFGKWYELSLLSGLVLTLTVPAFEFLTFRSAVKVVLYLASVLALAMLILVNFSLGWVVLAIAMAIIAIVKAVRNSAEGASWKKKVAPFATAILIVSVIFAWKGAVIMSPVIEKMAIAHTEVQLPWQSTLDVVSGTMKESAVFGAGPNEFTRQYLRYKPASLNGTDFWAFDFTSGVGFIPTGAVTLGLLGIIAWLAFFWTLIRSSVAVARQKSEDVFAGYTVLSSFVGTSFLWVTMLGYTPSHTLLLLTFVMTGVFIGASTYSGLGGVWNISWESKGKKGIMITFLLSLITLLLVVWGVWEVKMTVARLYYQGGSTTLSDTSSKLSPVERVTSAEKSLMSAVSWSSIDLYNRGLAEVSLLKMQAVINAVQNSSSTDARSEAIALATSSLATALSASQDAITANPANYLNYLTRAQVDEIATNLQVPDAYKATIQAYQNASAVNPYSPFVYYKAGLFETAVGHDDLAERYLGAAVQMKPDYADAIIQLGFLYYKNKAYEAAAQAFARVNSINTTYPNIHYYSGILLARVGRTADAIAEFEVAEKLNPNDTTIPTIITALKSGRSIFNDAATASTVTPAAIEKTATTPAPAKITLPTKKK
ncbi:hypothetical protein EB052_01225 [bacterium]|nr:hypothetical protein [bacterium]